MTTVQYIFILVLYYLTYNCVLSFPDSSNSTSLAPTISESTGNGISENLEWTEPVDSTPSIRRSPETSPSAISSSPSSSPSIRRSPISSSPSTIERSPERSPYVSRNSPIPSTSIRSSPEINNPSRSSPEINNPPRSSPETSSSVVERSLISSTVITESILPSTILRSSPEISNSPSSSPEASIPVRRSPILSTSIIENTLPSTVPSRRPEINYPPSSEFFSTTPLIRNSSLFSSPPLPELVEASPSLPSLQESIFPSPSPLQSPELDSIDERLNRLDEEEDKLINLDNLNTSEISPETKNSIEALYPFPEFQTELEDPVTTVFVLKAVVKSDPEFLGEVISRRDDDQAVADGLKVPLKVREKLTKKTPDRNDDGDVVLVKGLAHAGLNGRPSQSLANIIILSLTDFNQTEISPFLRPIQVVRKYLERVLDNQSYLEKIVKLDANLEAPVWGTVDRRLLVAGGSNVQSFTCSHCFPKRVCKVCFWCKKR